MIKLIKIAINYFELHQMFCFFTVMKDNLLLTLFSLYTNMAEQPVRDEAINDAMEALKIQIENLITQLGGHSLVVVKESKEGSGVAVDESVLVRQDHDHMVDISDLIEEFEGGILLSSIIQRLNITKTEMMTELGMGTNNAGYLNQFLNGKRPISNKNANRFCSWLESKGYYVPIVKMQTK